MGEEDDYDDDDWTGYEPAPWSWHLFAHCALDAVSEVVIAGNGFLRSLSDMFGSTDAKWRADKAKLDATDEAKRLLSALDDL